MITGGFVYEGAHISPLRGKYVFGDFVTGRLWAIELPEDGATPTRDVWTLGRWPVLPTTFGRGPDGELYIADFQRGAVYRLGPATER